MPKDGFYERVDFANPQLRDQDALGAMGSDRAGRIVDRDPDKMGIHAAIDIQARQAVTLLDINRRESAIGEGFVIRLPGMMPAECGDPALSNELVRATV